MAKDPAYQPMDVYASRGGKSKKYRTKKRKKSKVIFNEDGTVYCPNPTDRVEYQKLSKDQRLAINKYLLSKS